jgi:hypothetical protein
VGSGATGAIDKFQQIIGVMLPPATRQILDNMLERALGAVFGTPTHSPA